MRIAEFMKNADKNKTMESLPGGDVRALHDASSDHLREERRVIE